MLRSNLSNQAIPVGPAVEREGNSLSEAPPGLRHDFSRVPVHSPPRGTADHGQQAGQVRRMPGPDNQPGTGAGSTARNAVALAMATAVVRRAGTQLAPEVRREFEDRFGRDFSAVRVHSGTEATYAAGAVGAGAYTLGRHIVIREGLDNPSTPEGYGLLAHELTHVVQQTAFQDHQLSHVPVLAADHPSEEQARTGVTAAAPLAAPAIQRAPVDIVRSGQHVSIDLFLKGWRSTRFGAGQSQVVYILRDSKTGELLKVGKTTVKRLPGRFGEYVTAGNKWGRKVTADIYTFRKRPGRTVNTFEKEIRAGLEKTGHRLPWDNTDGRLSRKGKGIPSPEDPELEVIDEVEGELHEPKTGPEKEAEKEPGEKGEKGKGEGSAGAANLGIGISILGSHVGGANVGVSISVGSSSASAGTVGAGISWFSDSATAGGAGASISKGSQGAGAGVAGAMASEDTTAAAVLAAGAGTSTGATAAGAAVVGAGKADESTTAGAAVASHGEVSHSTVAGAGAVGSGRISGVTGAGTGSPEKPIDARDVRSSGADRVPSGQPASGVPAHEGSKPGSPTGGVKAGTQPGTGAGGVGIGPKAETQAGATAVDPQRGTGAGRPPAGVPVPGAAAGTLGTTQSAEAGAPAAVPGGTAAVTGTVTSGAAGPGSGSQPSGNLAVVPVFPPSASGKDRQMITAEAEKVAAMLSHAQDAQKLLLQYLASREASGQYLVPTSEWVARLLHATDGLSPGDIEYLKQLDWKPGHLSEKELRKRIHLALAHRKPTPASHGGESGTSTGEHKGGKATRGMHRGPRGASHPGPAPGTPAGHDAHSQERGTNRGSRSPGGGRDRATAPPPGVEHQASGMFRFVILSGLKALSSAREGQSVRCSVHISELDHGRRTFVLDDVSVTFDSRKDASTINVYFTRDFWSAKYGFHGLGGKDTLAEYSYPEPRGKR